MSTWALVGSPNSGKTTLYNWLTGSRSKTVNYPGATVEYSVGPLRAALTEKAGGYLADVIDTPGVYSLNPQSEDEVVTYKTLFEPNRIGKKIDAVIVVADVTQLNRHLVLVEQLKQTGYPILLAVTMTDLLEKQKGQFDVAALKNKFQIEVVAFEGLLGKGLDEMVQKMAMMSREQLTVRQPTIQEPAIWLQPLRGTN